MMSRALFRSSVVAAACLTLVPLLIAAAQSPLHGSLAPGPHEVGFRQIHLSDPTRPSKPKRRADGSIESGERSRQLAVHLWYPATSTGAPALTVAEYLVSHLSATDPATERRGLEDNLRRFLAEFGPVSDAAWSRLRQAPLLARRDAPAARGRYPLIVGQLRRFSTTVTNEYLASHGYVVGMIDGDSPNIPDPGAGLEIALRDMEFAVPELRKLPFVDQTQLGALGFSGSGFSQILFAMRHPDVDAVCDLESAIFDNRVFWPLSGGWGYDVTALRVPFLHTYSVPLSRHEARISDFENMRYSTRYRYLVDAPGIHHWDFALEGMAASAVLRNRGENGPRLQQVFETTNRYVLAFFDAHVKGKQEGLAFLERDPTANGAPAGLATIRSTRAIQAAPAADEFERMVTQRGIQGAMSEFDAARARDPQASLFQEARLNQISYRLLRTDKASDAIVLFRRVVELYPNSSNAYDSLAEALEAAGERAEALSISRRGLEVLSRENLPPERRQQMQTILEERVRRLGGS